MATAVIGALRVNLSIDTATFQRGMTAAEKMAYKFGNMIGGFLKNQLTSLNAAIVAVAGPAAIGLLIKNSIEATSAQVDLANRVGASVAAIQTLEHATALSGGSVEGLAKALGTLNVRLDEAAREGAGPAYEALQRLGLEASKIAELDADQKISVIADQMDKLGLSTRAQANILRDLGVRQQEIINLFQEGSEAINAAREELAGWGVLLSDVDAAKIEAAGDAWDKIKVIMTGIGNQLAIRLAPLIQAFAEWLGEAAKASGGFGDAMDKAILMGIQLFTELNKQIYLAKVDLDTLAGAFLDLFDTVAGAPANLLSTIFGGEASDYGFEPINKSYGKLKDTLEKPASFEEWKAWYEKQKAEMDELAKKSAAAMKNTGVGAGLGTGDGETEAERKSRERTEKQMQERLERLQESLMTEREAEQAAYEQRLADLAAFNEAQLLSTQEYADLKARIEKDHAEEVKRIEDDIAAERERNAQKQMDTYFDIADNITSALGSLFGDSKGWAIAEAIINTATAITKALAVYGPTPQGWAAAAAAAAAGIAQLATIRKTSSSSKGGGSNPSVRGSATAASGSGSNSSGSGSTGKDQTLFVRGIDPSQMFSGEVVRNLAQVLIDYQRDGGKVVLAQK